MTAPAPEVADGAKFTLSPVAIRVQTTIERMLPFAQGDDGDIYLLPASDTLDAPTLRLGLAELTRCGYLRHARLEGTTGIALRG